MLHTGPLSLLYLVAAVRYWAVSSLECGIKRTWARRRQKESMWPCQQPSAAWPGFLGRRLCCAPYGGACAGSPGPRSPRSADGPVIIISRLVLPDHFLAPWTAVSLASLRRDLKSHFSSVLYFVHSINLYCDPAPGLHPPVSRLRQELPRGPFLFFYPSLLFHPRSLPTRVKRLGLFLF